MNLDVSYSYQEEKPGRQIKVKASNASLVHQAMPTGLTVGEPNQSWHIDNYSSHSMGIINFDIAGKYEISMEIEGKKNNPIKFQWLWLEGEK